MKTLVASRCLVGGDKNPKNLHAYGDMDGQAEDAKLQHPLGVAFIQKKNVIAVTDTYNHKIKVIDPFNNEIFSWLGNGHATLVDDQTFECSLNEPSGIDSVFDEEANDIKVFIADCNNHCIRTVHYDTGFVQTPIISGIPKLGTAESSAGESTAANTTHLSKKSNEPDVECINGKCYPVAPPKVTMKPEVECKSGRCYPI